MLFGRASAIVVAGAFLRVTLSGMHVTVSRYAGAVTDRSLVPTIDRVPWADFAAYLGDHTTDHRKKGAAGYWVAAPMTGRGRTDAQAGAADVIALDWDDAPLDPEALAGLDYVAHTTDSHTDAQPRWRVWIRLARPTAGPFHRFRCPWPGAHLRAISQPVYIPTMGDDTWWLEGHGAGLDLDAWAVPVDPPAPQSWEPPAHRTVPSQASINALVTRWLSRPDGTNRLAGATGAALAEWGWSDDDIRGFLETWLGADARLGKHTDDAVRGARRRRAGDRMVGFPTLAEELGRPFDADGPEREDMASAILADDSVPDADPADPFRALTTAADIASWDPPPIDWLSETLAMAPGAPALITGYGGSGKTTFVQHLALCVATTGARLLGEFPVRHGSVLHIDHEQGADLTKRRYLRLGLTADARLDLATFPRWSLADTDPAARAYFERACRGRALVIVDSLLASCAAFIEDENASATREPLDWLGQVSARTGAVMLVIHHSKKDRTERMTSARGTSAITDAVSLHITYEKADLDPGTQPVLSLGKMRHEPPPASLREPIIVAMAPRGVPADGGYTLAATAAPDAAEVEAAALDAASVALLELLSGGWEGSATAAAGELKLSKQAVLGASRQLTQDGTIERLNIAGRSVLRMAKGIGNPV
jgi:KaiC/GvpD/RAD55 family RecA-like ATPase